MAAFTLVLGNLWTTCYELKAMINFPSLKLP